eukprot:3937669-Rhodomonas_salina.1
MTSGSSQSHPLVLATGLSSSSDYGADFLKRIIRASEGLADGRRVKKRRLQRQAGHVSEAF